VQQVPVSQARDLDGDGLPDVYELGADYLNPLNSADAVCIFFQPKDIPAARESTESAAPIQVRHSDNNPSRGYRAKWEMHP
jgi:hypothetical protein